MTWFNYHAKAKRLIAENQLTKVDFVDNWNHISPAMVLYFKEDKPMPIREYRWVEYFVIFEMLDKEYLKQIEFKNQK